MSSPIRLTQPPSTRPHLVVLQGGRAGVSAPFVVAPPAVLGRAHPSDRQVRADAADLVRCRRLAGDWR